MISDALHHSAHIHTFYPVHFNTCFLEYIHTVCSQESALHVLFVQFRVLFVVLYVKPCQRRFSVLGWTKFSESESLIFYQYYCINSTMCLLQQISHCIFEAHSLPFMLKQGIEVLQDTLKLLRLCLFGQKSLSNREREKP